MTKRLFLKLLSLGTFGAFVPVHAPTPKPKQYLTTCTWDELIGLRFEWPAGVPPDRNRGFKEWVICGKEVGTWNMYWARPVGRTEPLKALDFTPDWEGNTVYWDRVHLYPNMFYRA